MIDFFYDLVKILVFLPLVVFIYMKAPTSHNQIHNREIFADVSPEVANKEIDSLLCYDADMHNFLSEISQDTLICYIRVGLYRYFEGEQLRRLFIGNSLNFTLYRYENDSIYIEDSTIVNNDKLYNECVRLCDATLKFDSTECIFLDYALSKKRDSYYIDFIYKKYNYTLIFPLKLNDFDGKSYTKDTKQTLIDNNVYNGWILFYGGKNHEFQ